MAVFMAVFYLLDWYVFQGIKPLLSTAHQTAVRWIYWTLSLGMPLLMFGSLLLLGRHSPVVSFTASLFITVLVTKLVFAAVLLLGDAARVVEGGVKWAGNAAAQGEPFLPGRRKFVGQLALGLAVVPFASFLYGITKGKYNFKVHRHTLFFKDLPAAFDGFKIVQISDVHAGSFHDEDAVRRGVELVNAQNADLFVFTGDLVNSEATEFDRWAPIFKAIRAPFGQFSILGNHDYGDYSQWPSPAHKQANFDRLKQHHANIGFRLLLDEHMELEREGQKIALLGVENWGEGFGKRGDLQKATQHLADDQFKVLLSHDPSHWDAEVKNWPSPIHLTLSGHTHGMQMGVEIPGLRWSPVKYRYPKWAGVYEEAGRVINVNRGFGFLGFAGRVGIWPEVTVLELKKKGEA